MRRVRSANRWAGDAYFLAARGLPRQSVRSQEIDVSQVPVRQGVAGVHCELRLLRNAGYVRAGDASLPSDRVGQRPWVVVVLNDAPIRSDVDDVHIDLSPLSVRRDERGGPAIGFLVQPATLLPDQLQGKPVFGEQLPELG